MAVKTGSVLVLFTALVAASAPPGFAADGNGTPDDEDIRLETSEDCNSSGVPDECEQAILQFARVRDVLVDYFVNAMVAEDLDGATDLAVGGLDRGDSRLVVYRNEGVNGTDGFDALSEPAVYAVDFDVEVLRSGDLDGDGFRDLVVLSEDSFSVFWNQGNGTFPEAATTTALPSEGKGLSLADFNGDGALDVE